MRRYIVPLIIGMMLCSCNNIIDEYTLSDFDDVVLQIAEKERPAWICVGDFNVIGEMSEFGLNGSLRRFAKDYDFYFCDISTEENEHINYIYQLESLPVIMLVIPERGVVDIVNSNKDYDMIEKLEKTSTEYLETGAVPAMINTNFDVSGDALTDMYADVYSAYMVLKKGGKSQLADGVASADRAIRANPYFYNLYLGYKLHSALGDNVIAGKCYREAISWFEETYVPLYTYLCLEIVKENEGDTAEIEIESLSIDFGEIPSGQVTTKIIRYKNTGAAPLMIINASASCPCVQLDWTSRVMPGDSGEIRLHYHADDAKGPFHRSVILVPNTPDGSKMLSVRGEII